MNLAVLLLLFAPAQAVLLDEVFEIPASEWGFATITPKQPPSMIECGFRVVSGGVPVRVAVLDADDFRDLKRGHREALDEGEQALRGSLARMAGAGEDLAIVLENTGASGPVRVALEVRERPLAVGQLSPHRRWAVIAISVAVFLAAVIFSGRKLLSLPW